MQVKSKKKDFWKKLRFAGGVVIFLAGMILAPHWVRLTVLGLFLLTYDKE